VTATGVAWAAGGYLAGTFPSAWIVAKATGANSVLSASARSSGERDPHILMAKHVGVGWAAVAATLDVLKGFFLVLAARHWGHLDEGWLALAALGVVVGHCFPFYLKQMAGRGLAAASGVLLFLLPVEMTVCGLLIVIGGVARNTSVATTIGVASVPAVAAVQRQPGQMVAMGAGIFAIVLVRRLEGVGEVVRTGVTPGRAVLYRCIFDSSGPPPGRSVWDDERGASHRGPGHHGPEHVPPG
jgi:acyl phosphate:glycerol-3-phosphate acyltransferase